MNYAMDIEFSVIITTYNRESLIQEAIESLFAQSYKKWEAIVVDDGSTDNTQEIIQQYIDKGFPIQYTKQKNQGDAAAKNKGIELATKDYVTFLDSDDKYEPNHLELRNEILKHHPSVDLLHGGVKVIGDEYVPDVYHKGKKIHLSKCIIGSTFVFRKEKIQMLKGFKSMPIGSDVDLYERSLAMQLTVMETEIPTYIYQRTNNDSITHNFLS